MNTLTVREKCVSAMTAAIAAMTVGAPVADPYGVSFTNVYREPPKVDALTKGKTAVAVVLETNEVKKELSYGRVDCMLSVMVEINVYKARDEVAAERVNAHLGAVERMFRSDRTVGGNMVEIVFLGTEVTTEGPYENYAAGLLKMQIFYRHHTDDPRLVA